MWKSVSLYACNPSIYACECYNIARLVNTSKAAHAQKVLWMI